MLYQMLLGAWPPELSPDDAPGVAAFAARIEGWQQKALREAKRRTRWTDPNEPYEKANAAFLKALLTSPGTDFPQRLHEAVGRFAAAGIANALAQAVLRLTTPGIPDLYQGTEYWDFSLVDPDNRRPVDFAARRQSLDAATPLAELASAWRDGRLKQRVVHRLLQLRERLPLLFARGDYRPIASANAHVLAFERRTAKASVVVVVARHLASWLDNAPAPVLDATHWGDAALALPDGHYRDVLGDAATTWQGEVPLGKAFAGATVLVLERV
jgi:(1->4)-alpha-D-glucan 1-alpha-D-glucosylmutase